MRELPTGTVTLLLTDIEDSTLLLQQLCERYADLLAECRYLLRSVFHQWNRQEVDTQSDAFFVAFARASDAVAAAVDGRALASNPWHEGVAVHKGFDREEAGANRSAGIPATPLDGSLSST